MKLSFTDEGWEDYLYWFQTDPRMVRKVHALLKDALRHPHEGLGKPERLRESLSGYVSRRIDREHRLVYEVREDELLVVQARYHY